MVDLEKHDLSFYIMKQAINHLSNQNTQTNNNKQTNKLKQQIYRMYTCDYFERTSSYSTHILF